MKAFISRKLKFKAWNIETGLMMRLDSISCVKGELVKEGHVMLQYTGIDDSHGEELYDMDIVLEGATRQLIRWEPGRGGWCFGDRHDGGYPPMLTVEAARNMVRLCSWFESRKV